MNRNAVAYLGTGLLGAGMVEAMLGRGVKVSVWNRSREKGERLAALGARVCDTPAEAAQGADRVHLCLTADDAVDAVLEALLAGMAGTPTMPIIDHSTCSPAGVAERAARLRAMGVRFLHAPVFMSPQNARDKAGTILVSGDPELLADVRPALEAMAAKVLFAGERPDAAASLKLLGNALGIGLVAVLADILTLSRALDLPYATLSGLLDTFNPMAAARARLDRMDRGEFAPSFTLEMARKDVGLMLSAGAERDLPVLATIAGQMDESLAAGHGQEDYAVFGDPRVRVRDVADAVDQAGARARVR
jgi:3-hydroxyisobutyrate dehydrogenase